jgi:hypothetical protein
MSALLHTTMYVDKIGKKKKKRKKKESLSENCNPLEKNE